MSIFGRALILGGVLILTSCGQQTNGGKFVGNDVTSAAFGREFRLFDPDGHQRSLADFRGRYVVLFFGYTQCPDACPTALARAAEVRKQLGSDGDKVQVVFVTLDPERDTDLLMREYTSAFDPSFLGLRGDLAATRKVAEEFRVFYQKVPSGSSYTLDHSVLNYVFDPKGRLRLLWRPDETAAQCVSDLRILMKSERPFWRFFS